MPPVMPNSVDSINVVFRPSHCINIAAGMLANIVPINCAAKGNVDKDLSVANAKPTKAAVVTINEVELIIRLTQIANKERLRFRNDSTVLFLLK